MTARESTDPAQPQTISARAPEPLMVESALPSPHGSAAFTRFVGLIGVLLAAPWCYAAYRIFRYILHLEFVALMSMAMTMNPGQTQSPRRERHSAPRAAQSAAPDRVEPRGRPETTAPAADHPPLRRINPAVVEPTAHIWVGAMCWIGLLIFLAGLSALLVPRRSRRICRFTAWWVLSGTTLTLIGIFVLIRWGGFPPTLKPLAYGLITVVQSAYAVLLFIAARSAPRNT